MEAANVSILTLARYRPFKAPQRHAFRAGELRNDGPKGYSIGYLIAGEDVECPLWAIAASRAAANGVAIRSPRRQWRAASAGR